VTFGATGAGIALLSSTIKVNTTINGGPCSIASAQLLVNGIWVGTSTTGGNGSLYLHLHTPNQRQLHPAGQGLHRRRRHRGGLERDWADGQRLRTALRDGTEPTGTVTAGEVFAGATAPEESSSVTNINLCVDGTLAGSAANSTITNWFYTNALSDGTHTIYASTSASYITGWSPPRHLDDLARNAGCFSHAAHK
jgi:hypothetical protein